MIELGIVQGSIRIIDDYAYLSEKIGSGISFGKKKLSYL